MGYVIHSLINENLFISNQQNPSQKHLMDVIIGWLLVLQNP